MKRYQGRTSRELSPGLSRRQFIRRALAAPALAAVPRGLFSQAQSAGSPSVALTPSAFVISGRARFLAAGSMDYFRCPAELWRDRILKAKRAGLNTIMTYVAWNQHEPEEGRFNFEGRGDIARFLRTCAELEMLAVVRVGPFICDEFEAAGHPAWLIGKPGVLLRTPSKVAEPCIERWFKQLCGQIVPLQVSRGGPVILVQAENEYYYAERPGGLEYLQFLSRTLRRNGVDVPITGCGNGTELEAPEYLETINGYGRETAASFRRAHPTWPLLISEHYTDWMDVWTWPQTDYPKRPMLEQQSIEALSQGVMLSYFCFHGGTNFGFNGSSTWKTDHSWVTTRYWAQGPIAEGGALNSNYFAAKSASLPIAQFESFFASAKEVPAPLQFAGPVKTRALQAPAGTFLFVLPANPISADQRYLQDDPTRPVALVEDRVPADMESATGVVTLPSGGRVSLAAGSVRALLLPFRLRVDGRNVIDYANATLLGMGGTELRRVLIFWGESGREGHVSVNGAATSFRFPHAEAREISVGGLTVLALSSETADRTWFADGRVLIGPALVEERVDSEHACLVDEQTTFLLAVEADGSLKRRAIAEAFVTAEPTTLAEGLTWTRIALPEPSSDGEGWRSIEGPRSVEELGAYYGYTWYRARVSSATARKTGLLFTAAADRAHVWVDGRYAGVYGRGSGAERDLLPVELPAGEAVVTMLLDNMGRSSEGSAQQRKGIFGPVYAGASLESAALPALVPATIPEKVSWQFRKYKLDSSASSRCFSATWKLTGLSGQGFFLALRKMPQFAWIFLDGTLVGEHHGDNSLLDGFAASEYLLPQAGTGRSTELTLKFFGDRAPDLAAMVQLYTFPRRESLHTWQHRAWRNPGASRGAVPASTGEAKEPCWWETTLARPALKPPLFFATQGLSKGQVYLNGEAMGRYWELGPHHSVYLPEPALRSVNTIAVLDEAGNSPTKAFLMRDANVPTTRVNF